MDEELEELIQPHLKEIETEKKRRITIKVEKEKYRDLLEDLRKKGVRHLTAITGTDLGEEFELIYHLDWEKGTLLNIKISLPKEEGKLKTVTDLFPGAILYERENMEMLGIEFEGNPDPRRLFLADDWPENKHPLREGWFNYGKILKKNVSEIKDLSKSKEMDLDYEKMLEIEKNNKNRKTLIEWLKGKTESEEEEE